MTSKLHTWTVSLNFLEFFWATEYIYCLKSSSSLDPLLAKFWSTFSYNFIYTVQDLLHYVSGRVIVYLEIEK